MKRKVLALMCIVSVLMGLLAASGIGASATEETYRVGYSRVNITPLKVEGDYSSGVMVLPLRGHGDVWNRPSLYLMDDNGDGVLDENDGLFITCIAITDSKDKTVLLYTLDLIGVGDYSAYRSAICNRLGDQIEYSNIMLAGTHTHGAPDVSVYKSDTTKIPDEYVTVDGVAYSHRQMNTDLGIWIERTHRAAADAAELAMADRAPVTVRKGEISASQSVEANGRVMNSTRHYWAQDQGCVAGDNFNSRGSNPKQVGQVNDNMYMLEFCYEEGSGKDNVVLANWRGHPSLNSSSSNPVGRLTLTSDYVNAFRCRIETEGYRVAFFNGEGGNVNPRGSELDENGNSVSAWIDSFNNGDNINNNNRGNGYGLALGEMGLECLNTHMAEVDSTGDIVARQLIMNAERNLMGLSDLAYDASEYYLAQGKTSRYIYTDPDTGEKFVIASKHHANSVVSRWDRENSKPTTVASVGMELNTIQIGKDIAFVTVPGEPFDRYSLQAAEEMAGNLSNKSGNTTTKINAALTSANSYNDWLNIRGEVLGTDFGTPFVLGYCNGTVGYIPSAMTYEYNQDSAKWAWGSYETQTARVAQGTGERMIQTFAKMLTGNVEGTRTAWCEDCQEMKEWIPVSMESNMSEAINGHIYLKEDVDGPQILVKEGRKVCMDLNGYSYTGRTRGIYVYNGHKAAIFDTSEAKTGKMIGRGSENAMTSGFGGSTFIIEKNGELNLYSGTLTRISGDVVSAKNGGIGIVNGTLNMYGGLLTGGRAEAEGGSLYITHPGRLYMYGGRVDDGVAGNAYSTCVFTNSKVCLSGDASVAKIRYNTSTASGASKLTDWLTVQDEFTGSASLSFKSTIGLGSDVGDAVNAWMDGADITVADTDWAVVKQGTNLVVAAKSYQAQVIASGETINCNTLQNALEAVSGIEGAYAKLLCEIPETADIRLKKVAYLDLNGFDINGSIAVADDATLYCMDSVTDDYTVFEEGELHFGELTGSVTGNVQGVPVNSVGAPESETDSHRAGYLRVNRSRGISFHRVNLQITAMSLRASSASVYYKSQFRADEVAAEEVETFGIALCLFDPPTVDNLKTSCGYTIFEGFIPGVEGNTGCGTLLTNIMRADLGAAVNDSRGRLPVCGRAYIQTSDGYMFGNYVERTLVEQMEGVDEIWNSLTPLQQSRVLAMYEKYEDTMSGWLLPNIQETYLKQKAQ